MGQTLDVNRAPKKRTDTHVVFRGAHKSGQTLTCYLEECKGKVDSHFVVLITLIEK